MRTSAVSRNTSVHSVKATDHRRLRALACLLPLLFTATVTLAQSDMRPEHLAVGLLVGPVSGLGMKATYVEPTADRTGRSIDMALSFNLEGYVYSSVHTLSERVLPTSPLRVVIGPGMISEFDNESLRWGISGLLGAYFLRGPYEILLQLQPRLYITPDRSGSFGAAVGLRYRF